jgi:hypothetical protein
MIQTEMNTKIDEKRKMEQRMEREGPEWRRQ